LSTRSVIYAHRILSNALGDAVRWGLIMRNPATLVSPPRLVTPEMKVWSAEDARRFLDAVSDDRLYAMWMLFVMTGMRRGEVLGLRWQDVDLAAGRIAVRQTLVEVAYEAPLLRAEDEALASHGEHRWRHRFCHRCA
jgi:integrase